ncbi:MAG: hypothetical protein CM1200mP3_00980 [Chloroflexota bacterium]|nr:MAG: hypothetical protein CM1200mP3_00980 [Chloroflexota bacterium]
MSLTGEMIGSKSLMWVEGIWRRTGSLEQGKGSFIDQVLLQWTVMDLCMWLIGERTGTGFGSGGEFFPTNA